MQKHFYVYILTSKNHRVLYTGVTNDLQRRVGQHQERSGSKFTSRYHVDQLLYYEIFDDVRAAIAREKQIKAGSRQKKIELVNNFNPEWRDLAHAL